MILKNKTATLDERTGRSDVRLIFSEASRLFKGQTPSCEHGLGYLIFEILNAFFWWVRKSLWPQIIFCLRHHWSWRGQTLSLDRITGHYDVRFFFEASLVFKRSHILFWRRLRSPWLNIIIFWGVIGLWKAKHLLLTSLTSDYFFQRRHWYEKGQTPSLHGFYRAPWHQINFFWDVSGHNEEKRFLSMSSHCSQGSLTPDKFFLRRHWYKKDQRPSVGWFSGLSDVRLIFSKASLFLTMQNAFCQVNSALWRQFNFYWDVTGLLEVKRLLTMDLWVILTLV